MEAASKWILVRIEQRAHPLLLIVAQYLPVDAGLAQLVTEADQQTDSDDRHDEHRHDQLP